jgi:putative acetyltransferase
MKDEGARIACVLGDPSYYQRFGFRPDSRIEPPFRLPEEWSGAWQSQYLGDEKPRAAGKLEVPAPWMDEALWLP